MLHRHTELSYKPQITYCQLITVRNSSCGKVIFSHASVSHSVHGGAACGMCDGGACVAGGVHGGGDAWQGGHAWRGGHAW